MSLGYCLGLTLIKLIAFLDDSRKVSSTHYTSKNKVLFEQSQIINNQEKDTSLDTFQYLGKFLTNFYYC